MRVRGIGFCNAMRIEEFATLSYADPSVPTEDLMYPSSEPPSYDTLFPQGITLNHHSAPCYSPEDSYICAADLESHEIYRDNELIDASPNVRLYVGFDVVKANNSRLFSGQEHIHYASEKYS